MTWQISIDTGGTFTDAYAVDPEGRHHRTKILSNSTLRLPVLEADGTSLRIPLSKPKDFFKGFTVDDSLQIATSSDDKIIVPRDDIRKHKTIELTTHEEAPILAIRLLTNTALGSDFPPLELRVGTTRGTNALLENRGADTVLFTTPGFRDLLTIGDQRRPDLFALQHPAHAFQGAA